MGEVPNNWLINIKFFYMSCNKNEREVQRESGTQYSYESHNTYNRECRDISSNRNSNWLSLKDTIEKKAPKKSWMTPYRTSLKILEILALFLGIGL